MKRRRIAVVLALLVVLVSAAVFVAVRGAPPEGRVAASGTVEATRSDLGFNLPGRIAEVAVREGDRVQRGAVLARLESAELEARHSAALAQVRSARALLTELETGARGEEVAQARSAERAAARRLDDAARDLARARRLFEGGAISREALDRAETAFELADAAHDQAREQLGVVESGPRPERIAAQRAALESAEALARQAEAALDHAIIRSPIDGVVTVRHREPGETVQPGLPVLSVLNPDDRWVRIYIPENRMGAIAIGQHATITSDTFRGREYPGRVIFIASEAEFTPRNVQTREERVKLVYAVRIQITGDPSHELKPGMPADVLLVRSGVADRAER